MYAKGEHLAMLYIHNGDISLKTGDVSFPQFTRQVTSYLTIDIWAIVTFILKYCL